MRRRQVFAAKAAEQAGFIVGSNNYDALPKSYTVFHDVPQEKPEVKPIKAKKSRTKK